MISFDRFERSLPALLDELAAPRPPDYADDLFARTAATRQRPGWTLPGRWLPMTVIPRQLAAVPGVPWRLASILALLVLAAVVAALAAGMLKPRFTPFGPARNGNILFVDATGSVVVANPTSGVSDVIVLATGSANTKPVFSPDGTKFFILRPSAAGSQHIFVVDLEGNETRVTPNALTAWHYVGWSPRGDRILVRDDGGRILLVDAMQPAEPVSLTKGLGLGNTWIGVGFNYTPNDAFRPPYGDEIMFLADGRLVAIQPDQTGLRTIVDPVAAGLAVEIEGPQWSPDGTRIAFGLRAAEDGPWNTYIVNADGSGLRPVSRVGDQFGAKWSPDGTRIAFEYATAPASGTDWVPHPLGVVDVETGQLRDVGPVSEDGYLSWTWSPDGESILEVPKDGFGKVLIVNATTGITTTTTWSVDQPISWQRLEP